MNKDITEKFTLFWHGPFSQWSACKFTVWGIEYNCCEQYMMACKARMFGDTKSLDIIMGTTSPKDQKAEGRKVENFDVDKWNVMAKDFVFMGNYAKFTQDEDLLKTLMATEGTTLVEASPRDTIWGIGLGADNPKSQNRATWRGTNWLGEVLTNVRTYIKGENIIKDIRFK